MVCSNGASELIHGSPDHADMLYYDPWQHEENKYKLESPVPYLLRDCPQYVTFMTPDPVKYPVPSRTYLGIHAACAKVAHLSGAGECIDKFHQDLEDWGVLDPDGGSVDILEHAIFGLQISGYEVTA